MLSWWRPVGFAVPFDDVDNGICVIEKCVLHGSVDIDNALTGATSAAVAAFSATTAATGLRASS